MAFGVSMDCEASVSRKSMWLVGILVTAVLAGAGYSLRPIRGQVVVIGTNTPVADAYVTAMWTGTQGFADGVGTCLEVRVAKTDSAGKFSIGRWTAGLLLNIANDNPKIVAFKPGYSSAMREHFNGRIRLVPMIDPPRSLYLRLDDAGDLTFCEDADFDGALFPLVNELASEAKSTAITETQRQQARILEAVRDNASVRSERSRQ